MTKLAITCLAFLTVSSITFAYEYDEFIRDSKDNPEAVYDHLHPEAKHSLKRSFNRLRTNKKYRDFVFYHEDPDLEKKTDREIWRLVWEECNANNYETTVLIKSILIENDNTKLYLTEETLYKKQQGRIIDAIIFKKHGDEYLPMIPENIIVALYSDTY